jgi:hypothetical protein
MRPLGPDPETVCWHCGRVVERNAGVHAARYIYRGEQAATAIVEDWMQCECGAYQNLRRLNAITIEPLGRS